MKAYNVLALVAQTEFAPFTETDFSCYAGVESANPLIGQAHELTVIIDGATVSLINEYGEEQQFHLCENFS